MSSSFGKNIKITVFGQSHGEAIGVVIDNLPVGEDIDQEQLQQFLQRRAGGGNAYSTPRKEEDKPVFLSGLVNNQTCGAPLCAIIKNNNLRSADYQQVTQIPRPSHADYPAFVKYRGYNDVAGGGHFSGRLTAPLCLAGGICLQILSRRQIEVYAKISKIHGIADSLPVEANSPTEPSSRSAAYEQLMSTHYPLGLWRQLPHRELPVFNQEAGQRMVAAMIEAGQNHNSLGGIIQCCAFGVPVGLGEPMFDGLENQLAAAIFGIPAVKGIQFGTGFDFPAFTGAEANDPYLLADGKVVTATNHNGGILGGITNGMPLDFQVVIKPTPSIQQPQNSVNLTDLTPAVLTIQGRHDPCIVPRAVPCVEAVAGIVLLDNLVGNFIK